MIVCRDCGHGNEPDDTFCGSCGAFLEFSGEAAADAGLTGLEDDDPVVEGIDEERATGAATGLEEGRGPGPRITTAIGLDEQAAPSGPGRAPDVDGAAEAVAAAEADAAAAAEAEAEARAAAQAAAAAEAEAEAAAATARAEREAEAARAKAADERAARQRAEQAAARAAAEAAEVEARAEAELAALRRAEESARAQAEAEAAEARAAAEAEAERHRAEAEAARLQAEQAAAQAAAEQAEARAESEAEAARVRAEAERSRQDAAAARLEADRVVAESNRRAEEAAAAARAEVDAARAEAEAARAAAQAEADARAEAEAAAAEARRVAEEASRRTAAEAEARAEAEAAAERARVEAEEAAERARAEEAARKKALAERAAAMVAVPKVTEAPPPRPPEQPPIKPTGEQRKRTPPTPPVADRTPRPGELICGGCGAPNDPERNFCRRCGKSLVEAVVVPTPWWQKLRRRPRAPVAAGERPGRRGGRAAGRDAARSARYGWRRFLSLRGKVRGLLGLLAILGLASTTIGPFSGVGQDAWERVRRVISPQYDHQRPTAATASSSLPGRDPGALIDDIKQTFWAEAADGPGIGETITLTFAEPTDIDRIGISPGASERPEQFVAHPRPRELHVVLEGDPVTSRDITVADSSEFQHFSVKGRKVTRVVIEVRSVHLGTENQDLAIAGIEFFVRR